MTRISANSSMVRVCIICDYAQHGHPQVGGDWQSLSSGAGAPRLLTTRESGRGENLQLNNQLPVILLVRKILRIPTQFLESLLRDCGDPSQWGIELCRTCMGVFKKAEVVHSKISKLIEEFEGLADKLREELRESDRRRRKNGGKDETLLETKSSRRTKGKGNKNELIRSVTKEASSASMNLRQECLKISREKNPELRTNKKKDSSQSSLKTSITIGYEDFSCIGKVELEGDDADKGCSNVLMHTLDDIMDHDFDDSLSLQCFEQTQITETLANVQTESIEIRSIPELSPVKVKLNATNNKGDIPNSEDIEDDLEENHNESKAHFDNKNDNDDDKKEDKMIDDRSDGPSQPSDTTEGYYCDICAKRKKRKKRLYKTKDMLESHKRKVHQRMAKPFECKLCGRFFSANYLLRKHMLAHSKLNDRVISSQPSDGFYCYICPKPYGRKKKLYKTEDLLESHERKVHQKMAKPFECKDCGKFFLYNCILRRHILSHLKVKNRVKKIPFCKECNREFGSMRGFRIHMQTRRHVPRDRKKLFKPANFYPYECLECDKKFKTKGGFNGHMDNTKKHNPGLKYQCEFCTKGFMQKASLQSHHALEHHAELNIEPFKCTFCNKKFASKRNLRNHVGVQHTKNYSFKCSECNMGFMVSSTYKRHVAVVHAKEKLFQCTDCPKRFSNSNQLNIHMRVHSGEKPLKCKDCGKEFADPPTFNRHRETHEDTTYVCSFCGKQFKVWHSYRIHMKRHNQHIFKVSTQNMPTRVCDNSNVDSTPAPGSEASNAASSLR